MDSEVPRGIDARPVDTRGVYSIVEVWHHDSPNAGVETCQA